MMKRSRLIHLGMLLLASACDDTADALSEEAREEKKAAARTMRDVEVKAKAVAEEAEREIEQAADAVKKEIDEADEALADEIRGED